MNVAEYFIKNKIMSWMFTLLLIVGGALSYMELGRLEDPKYTIKDALVLTSYPGATPLQVEEEVSYPIEKQLLTLSYVDEIKSINSSGLSQITVTMKDTYGADELPQIWDELRRKVNDLKSSLPPGVGEPRVLDDFGDVYGVMLAVTGEGYSYEDLMDYVDFLKREIELVSGVAKVAIAGQQQEQVFIEVSLNKIASLGLNPNDVFNQLTQQNMVQAAGAVRIGNEYVRFHPTGELNSVKGLEDLVISSLGSNKLIYLKDVATVSKGYAKVPSNILHFNAHPAINIGVSFADGVNVVNIGKQLDARLQQLEQFRPAGMELATIYEQPKEVERSVSAFALNLLEAVAIVVVVLLIFMGVRSGLLIGLILFLTVLGTFLFMKWFDIELQRISLGALIIALGMLVDNAIVVVEGILVGQKSGQTKLEASKTIVAQTIWPLLGATIIAIIAFAPIGLSPDSTGEFAGSLFWVLLISLFLSWVTAISLTPFFANLFFKEREQSELGEGEAVDPYKGLFFSVFKVLLSFCLRFKALSMIVVVALFALSIWGFGAVKQSFFPPSTTPMFLIDLWLPEGSDIHYTREVAAKVEQQLLADKVVQHVTTTVGQGAQRFMLTYEAERAYAAYAQLIVRVDQSSSVIPTMAKAQALLDKQLPFVMSKLKQLQIGPSPAAAVEVKYTGPDPDVLRQLAQQTLDIFYHAGGTVNVRHDWRERTKVLEPQFDEEKARRLGINKSDVDNALQMYLSGLTVGLYREGTSLLPIVVRVPDEGQSYSSTDGIRIWSPVSAQMVPLSQVVDGYEVVWQDPLIQRKDRKRVITVMVDPDFKTAETATSLRARVLEQVEAIPLPTGYQMEWDGEYGDASKAEASLFSSLPLGYLAMFMITVFLFNSVKKPLVIWACVPLALIGVVSGLLILNKPFGFMALLGMLSLSGMLLKNGIVLLDQINFELAAGKAPYQAVFDSAISRVRPVCMAAITTILGMLPLLIDAFFESMAAVVMFGLGVATVLTLLVVPVLFCLLHGIKTPSEQ